MGSSTRVDREVHVFHPSLEPALRCQLRGYPSPTRTIGPILDENYTYITNYKKTQHILGEERKQRKKESSEEERRRVADDFVPSYRISTDRRRYPLLRFLFGFFRANKQRFRSLFGACTNNRFLRNDLAWHDDAKGWKWREETRSWINRAGSHLIPGGRSYLQQQDQITRACALVGKSSTS